MSPSWSRAEDRDTPKADPELLEGVRALAATLETRHPPQLILSHSSLPQHSQTRHPPHGLLQELLLFPGMFLSKIVLMGLTKKRETG